MSRALANVNSFQVTYGFSGSANSAHATFVMTPLRMHLVVTQPDGTLNEGYYADGYLFMKRADGGWSRKLGAPPPLLPRDMMGTIQQMRITRDIFYRGRTYASFIVLDDPHRSASSGTRCTVDRKTHLLSGCRWSGGFIAYSDYNNPANIVRLPIEALSTR